jgi:hypothetical protein
VVMHAEHVGETEVDELDLVFLDQVEHFVGGHGATSAMNGELVRASLVPAGACVARQRLTDVSEVSNGPERSTMVQYG